MNKQQVEQFVMRYLEATDSQVIEKSPGKVSVKLSPAADKALTGRSYYWNFVERTGAEPETMTFSFIFDPNQAEAEAQHRKQEQAHKQNPSKSQNPPQNQNQQSQSDSILGRYFGFIPSQTRRSLDEPIYFGSSRLEQMFQASKSNGQFVNLYEIPPDDAPVYTSIPYTSWFMVNYKVELICDMKRDELHSLAISLSTGEIIEQAYDRFIRKQLTPRLPARTHIKETISYERAVTELEKWIEHKVKGYDHSWSYEAHARLKDELSRIDGYYKDLMKNAEPEILNQIEQQYEHRQREIRWQYEPRVQVSAINGGLFHLIES